MTRSLIPLGAGQNILEAVQAAVGASQDQAELWMRQGSLWYLPPPGFGDWGPSRRLRDPAEVISTSDEVSLVLFAPSRPITAFSLPPENICWEDEHLLVVWKPANVNTVPTPFSDLDCLVHGAQGYLDKHDKTAYRVNAVHRLDMPAQGLVLLGKNKEVERSLHALFAQRKIHKVYGAHTPWIEGLGGRTRWYVADRLEWRAKVQEARSFLGLLGGNPSEGCYFGASPLTGRPHQLRKHFAKVLKPLWGDVLYGDYQIPETLHLASILCRFRHPVTRQVVEVKRLPDWWNFEAAPLACLGGLPQP